jgi:transmembrane 9 superfamily member 1
MGSAASSAQSFFFRAKHPFNDWFFLNSCNNSTHSQGAFYFGYTAIGCFAFFLMLGTVGWRSSLLFVRQIYKAIKAE